ncbi:hypothetical protein OKW22_000674 [Bacilli bacterium PM5-3]|nr:hypothetical protein [Bacilli bacterium PM5-3]
MEVKIKLIDKTTIELLEDAKKGDIIKLDNLDDIQLDLSKIEEKIKESKDLEYEKYLEKEISVKRKEFELSLENELQKKDSELIELKTKLSTSIKEAELQLKSNYEVQILKLESEIKEIKNRTNIEIENEKNKVAIGFNQEKESLNTQIALQKQEIESLKDFRLKQSTKMVGESLEQHCEIMYNQYGRIAFPNAEFYKDNDASLGSKGDYIFKEYDENGNLLLSIMFEMKNEQDTTATKHKNSDFFKKLDDDRNKKDCEYAVLVSMLEQNNDLYNDITKVWEYDNMFVIRPQHFINIISLLRIGSLKSQQYKVEIEQMKNASIDIIDFESKLETFKDDFGRNYSLASKKFTTAIDQIDKTIENLHKIRENLLGSDKYLRIANEKLDKLSIKKLAKNNNTIEKLIDNNNNE